MHREWAPVPEYDTPLLHGNMTFYDERYAPGPEFERGGVFIRSVVGARSGPNLLSVSRVRADMADPLDGVMFGAEEGPGNLAALYAATQHRVAQTTMAAVAGAQPRLSTKPGMTSGSVLVDPRELEAIPGCERCVEITGGTPFNRSVLNRVRYHAD